MTGNEPKSDDFVSTPPIEVDIESLGAFREMLLRELRLNLEPGSARVVRDHSMGPQFGHRNPGPRVGAAQDRYHRALLASTMNLREYIRTADILIEVIHTVMSRYSSADLAAADATPMSETLAKIMKDREDAAAPYAQSETNRETHKANFH